MSDWQAQQAELAAEFIGEIKAGKYANGYEQFKAKRAENFGVSRNNAVRQFANFSKSSPVAARGLSELLQFSHAEADLSAYSEEERDMIYKFLWVAQRLAKAFGTQTSRRDFAMAVHHTKAS
jgi:hypothetical protein